MCGTDKQDSRTPGSDEAIAAGCTCPRIDNHYGRGFPSKDGRDFWIDGDCPLHVPEKLRAEIAVMTADKQAQMAVEGRGPLPHDVRLAMARAIGKSASIENHMVRADIVYAALCDAMTEWRRCNSARPAEQFGFTGPTEEQNYGTSDPIGFGDIEYPADVQPPEA